MWVLMSGIFFFPILAGALRVSGVAFRVGSFLANGFRGDRIIEITSRGLFSSGGFFRSWGRVSGGIVIRMDADGIGEAKEEEECENHNKSLSHIIISSLNWQTIKDCLTVSIIDADIIISNSLFQFLAMLNKEIFPC
jgi:hypothetical protein